MTSLITVQSISAQPDFEKIKSNVEQSAQERKEFRESGGEVGQQFAKDSINNQDIAPEKAKIKIIWSMLGGRIKYWQVDGQYFLHLG